MTPSKWPFYGLQMGAANHLQVLDDPPRTQVSQSLGDVGAFVSLEIQQLVRLILRHMFFHFVFIDNMLTVEYFYIWLCTFVYCVYISSVTWPWLYNVHITYTVLIGTWLLRPFFLNSE